MVTSCEFLGDLTFLGFDNFVILIIGSGRAVC